MAERADITVVWPLSPRLAEVALPSTELNAQDLHDTLNSNTLQPGVADDSLENMDDDNTVLSEGKSPLGGANSTDITLTLLDTQVAFGRTASRSSGAITTGDTRGVTLIDNLATFQTDLVKRGDWVLNFTDQSVTEVLSVDSQTQLTCRPLSDGTDNRFDALDAYKVWEVAECTLIEGNFIALDDLDADINPLFTTFGRFATRTAAASATISETGVSGLTAAESQQLSDIFDDTDDMQPRVLNTETKVVEIWQDRGLDPNQPKTIVEITANVDYDEIVDAITKEVRKTGGTVVITRQ